jgi:CBS domain-containing protein
MLAKEVMTSDVHAIPPDMPIADIADLLLSRKLAAVPVVDGEGRLLGIVSEADLIHRAEIGTEPHHTWWEHLLAGRDEQTAEFVKVHGMLARNVMARELVTADENTPLADVVGLFDRFAVGSVAIIRDQRLTGMVHRSNVLRLLAQLKREAPKPDTSDAAIRTELDKIMDQAVWATVTPVSSSISYELSNGVVRIRGIVGSEAERDALCLAAAAIPGVRAVDPEIALVPRDITSI